MAESVTKKGGLADCIQSRIAAGSAPPPNSVLEVWIGMAAIMERGVTKLEEDKRLGSVECASLRGQMRQLIRILPGREEQHQTARDVLDALFVGEQQIIHKDFAAVKKRAERAEEIVAAAKEYIREKCFGGEQPDKDSNVCDDYAHCKLKHLCAIVRAEG